MPLTLTIQLLLLDLIIRHEPLERCLIDNFLTELAIIKSRAKPLQGRQFYNINLNGLSLGQYRSKML